MSYINLEEIGFKDGPILDAFGRLRVSEPITLFDAQQEYGLNTIYAWSATANGAIAASASDASVTSGSNAVGPTNTNTRLTPITVSTTNGHYSILQSQQYIRYSPGKSHLTLITGVFATSASSVASIVLRTSTSGSVVESVIQQADWNIDTFTPGPRNPSGKTLDFTKTQILFISAQWLGVGRAIVGFDIDGQFFEAHEFLNANVITVPYTQTFNLPVRMEVKNTGSSTCEADSGYFDNANGLMLRLTDSTTAGGTIQFNCCSVISEGAQSTSGILRSANMGVSALGVTTRRPILSIRPKSSFNSRTNRGIIIPEFERILAKTNDALIEIVRNGTLTGASFASVGANSIAEFDIAATAISGGQVIDSFYAASGTGSTTQLSSSTGADFRNPICLDQINALTANQVPLTIVATSLTGTSNLLASVTWTEKYL